MMNLFMGLLFLSGLPVCLFLLPSAWWPWSTFVWFIGFIVFERSIRQLAARWRGHPLPAGPIGLVVGLAIAIDDGNSGSGDGGDGGGDGGGGGD